MYSTFEAIDDALAEYYERLSIPNYRDANAVGLFLNYITTEQLNDPELPIENELGDDCDPNDCVYTWMNNHTLFPIPSYAQIPHNEKEAFMFYIIKYCYKHNQPPSDIHIQTIIVPKCNGTINITLLPTNTSRNNNDDDKKDDAPMAFAGNMSISQSNGEEKINYNTRSDCEEMEGQVREERPTTSKQIIRVSEEEFKTKYPPRAHLNVFTPKELTKELRGIIEEEFENNLILYYYTDISTALQINDKQMKEFKILMDNDEQRLSVINYDLHVKGQSEEVLYGIIVPNDNYKLQCDKWLWKLDEFLTVDHIYKKYKIKPNELPKSSRKMLSFERQLSQQLIIEESLIDETEWFNIQQIKSLKRNVKIPKVRIILSKEMWILECKKSFSNVDLPLIPVVVNKNNNHWIEWIKIVKVESQNIYVGISLKCDENNNKWSVQSICLDRGDIYNKHRLVGLQLDEYNCQLTDFKISITEIKFSDNDSKDIDKKMNVLRQQICSQQESIVRLKESLLRTKNGNKYSAQNESKTSEQAQQLIDQDIKQFIDENADDITSGDECDLWLDQIVDDVIKPYDVLQFKTTPIGAKRNIYIEKQFTKLWMEHVTPRFNDEAMMYYWFDYTTAMQMCQGYSKQYRNKHNGKFVVVIVNYELKDQNNSILYGIVLCHDGKSEKKRDKYRYKLTALMTKEQIKMEYGIHEHDLPKQSRKNKEFINKLLLRRKISKQDINHINWSNLKLFKSQSTNKDPINKSIAITQKVMKEYCNVAMERLNTLNNNNLIPIVVINKYNNYYGIEWILIVDIIHKNCDVGISFRYDEQSNVFVATAIYLDKGEIESKHKLVGLKFDYCKHLREFSVPKFRFKSGKVTIDDDDISNNHQIQQLMQYKQAFEMEQAKAYQLQTQIQQTQNICANLKYQNDQYVIHQPMMVQQQQINGYQVSSFQNGFNG